MIPTVPSTGSIMSTWIASFSITACIAAAVDSVPLNATARSDILQRILNKCEELLPLPLHSSSAPSAATPSNSTPHHAPPLNSILPPDLCCTVVLNGGLDPHSSEQLIDFMHNIISSTMQVMRDTLSHSVSNYGGCVDEYVDLFLGYGWYVDRQHNDKPCFTRNMNEVSPPISSRLSGKETNKDGGGKEGWGREGGKNKKLVLPSYFIALTLFLASDMFLSRLKTAVGWESTR